MKQKQLLQTIVFGVFSLLCVQNQAVAHSDQSEIAHKMDTLVSKYHEYGQFNGSVLVSDGGKVIFKKGYGLANIEWNMANQPDTKFRLASITKQFTSMAIMQLVAQGKIKLGANITEYLPDYRKDTGSKFTIHQLLNHTAGVPSYTSNPDFFAKTARQYYSVDEFTKTFCSDDLAFEPGSEFSYSNSGYFLLGDVIEKVTGKSYADAIKAQIFDPLGMKNSGYDLPGPIITNRAAGYLDGLDGYENAPFLEMALPYSAGSLYSTVEDMYLWDQALHGEKLLSAKYKKIMFTPALQGYAYGWGIQKHKYGKNGSDVDVTTHSGGINGFNTLITRMVKDNRMIVLLHNAGNGALSAVNTGLANILYGNAYDQPKRSTAKVLYSKLKTSDIKAMVKHYHDLQKNHSDEYVFHPGVLNSLGYQLLGQGMDEAAVAVFELNVESYPEGANTHDSLGEAYMKTGKKAKAIASYKKSLALAPQNENAKAMLKKLQK